MTPPTIGYSPVGYLGHDRRRKPASPAEYLDLLAERDCIDRSLVVGGGIGAIVRTVSVSVTQHGMDEHPGAVLNDLLADGKPVLLMGNTTDQFMRERRLLSPIEHGRPRTASWSTASTRWRISPLFGCYMSD